MVCRAINSPTCLARYSHKVKMSKSYVENCLCRGSVLVSVITGSLSMLVSVNVIGGHSVVKPVRYWPLRPRYGGSVGSMANTFSCIHKHWRGKSSINRHHFTTWRLAEWIYLMLNSMWRLDIIRVFLFPDMNIKHSNKGEYNRSQTGRQRMER